MCNDGIISTDQFNFAAPRERRHEYNICVVACCTACFTVRLNVGTQPITPYVCWDCVEVYSVRARFVFHCLKLNAWESSLALTDHNSYLEPTEPDDQEMDYDNIWPYDCDTGVIPPASGISTHRTGLDFVARGLGGMATGQRWS